MNKKLLEKIKHNHIGPDWFLSISDLLVGGVEFVKTLNESDNSQNIIVKNKKELEYFKKLVKNINPFLLVKSVEEFVGNMGQNIDYVVDINYSYDDYNFLKDKLQVDRNRRKIYLLINSLSNQDEVNNSYFLEIYNLFKKANFIINKDCIRYESAYKNIYLIGPRELTFDISEYCNANCIFCYTNGPGFLENRGEENENKYKQKTNIENLINIVKESEYVGIDLLTLGITGDPFISKKFISPILKVLPSTNLKVGFLTNGYGLLENVDEIINCKNIESFYINISAGDLDSFTKTRIGDKFIDFLNTWKAIKMIKTNRPDIKIKALYVVTPLNYLGINDFINLCKNNLVDEIEFKEVVNYGFEEKMSFSDNDVNDILDYIGKVKDISIKNNKEQFIEGFNRKLDTNIKQEEKYNKLPEKCYNQYLYNAIVRDVTYTCCKFIVSLGNVVGGKLGDFYKTIEKNNKIFQVSQDIKETVGEKKYLENCSRCFHLKNVYEMDNYIEVKNKLIK